MTTDFSHRDYFTNAIKGKTYKSDPYISMDTDEYCIAISVPIRKNDNIKGVLMADLKI